VKNEPRITLRQKIRTIAPKKSRIADIGST
jgi:hypothetical protein